MVIIFVKNVVEIIHTGMKHIPTQEWMKWNCDAEIAVKNMLCHGNLELEKNAEFISVDTGEGML